MLRLIFACLVLAFVISCDSNQVDPAVDCSANGPSLAASATPSDCGDPSGSATATVTGGASPYVYAINTATPTENSTGIFEGLAAGNYEITVTDANNCTATATATVASASGPSIASVETTDAGCGTTQGSISVEASGGEGTLSFSLDGGDAQASNVFSGLAPGSYELIVADESGCETLQQVEVLSGISLNDDISPIISSNCAVSGCHDGTRSPNLSTKAGIISSSSRIFARTSQGTMPPSGALSSGLVDQIECWVNDNSPDN